ncbi:hypothetical protein [Streptomyces orinoci]|uniref:Uncharacterized protein n=1 Tax=Streptomyces orinoci TaxID=67339 RepID=A0ABV3K135_STRON|nr:hypothetical protein [Streptomyces orinoci]
MSTFRSIPRLLTLAALPAVLVAGTITNASAAPSDHNPGPKPSFGLAAAGYRDITGLSADTAGAKALKTQGFGVRTSPSGQTAVVDSSMADEGIITAANPSFVDISWKAYAKGARYTVVRDDRAIATLAPGVSGFRDTAIARGATYQYRIVPELAGDHSKAHTWGMRVTVPAPGKGESDIAAMRKNALARAGAASVAGTTTVTWNTFIPQSRIDAPLAGCDYGRGFQFAGDGHSSFDWRNPNYRTSLNAVINWRRGSVDGYKNVHPSHVYVKKTGRLVATKTATDKYMVAKKMGSGSNYVDVRLVTHATNPFCNGLGGVKGAIDGAIQMHLTTSGNWEIRSGTHRLMPNHYIYIYDGGRVTNVYTRSYANALCLIGSATCPEADLTGYYGKFS